jgi:hypothetical protein
MRESRFILGAAALMTLAAFLKLTTDSVGYQQTKLRLAPSAIDSPEDPYARARQEWLQLRDPGTGNIPAEIRAKELAYAKTLPSSESLVHSGLRKGEVLSWTSRGPVNQGGRTRALAFDISDVSGNTILAGGVSGGMWRSTDGGTSWSRATSRSDSVQSVSCVAQDPRAGHQTTWYYGTGELLGNSASAGGYNSAYRGDGVFKSVDGGMTWQQLPATAVRTPQQFASLFDYVLNIVVDPTNGNVYAAMYGGIQRSTDGGSTWNFVLGGTTTYSMYSDVGVTSTGIFYAALSSDGSNAGIYRSTTGAAGSWVNITAASWPTIYNRVVLAIAPSNENVAYFLGDTPGSGYQDTSSTDGDYTSFWKYTYVSGDGSGAGGTWSDRHTNLPNYGGKVGNFSHQGGYDLVVKVKPDNPDFVFIGGTNLYRSSDAFTTKTSTRWIGGYSTANDFSQFAGHHCDEHALAFKPGSPGVLLSGSDGGVSKTTNDSASSVSWSSLNNGYRTSQFYSIAIDQGTTNDPVIIGGMQDNSNMFTNDRTGAAAWVVMPGGGDGCISAMANGKTHYYIGTQNGTILRLEPASSDWSSYTWTVVTPTGASGFMFVTPYVLDPNNSDIMYLAAGDEIWRNSNLSGIANFQSGTSTNWTALSNTIVNGHDITALGVSTSPTNRVYYGTDSSQVFRIDNANTGNPTPTNISGSGFPPTVSSGGAYVSCIAVNPRNADSALVVFSNYGVPSLFFTANGGTNWVAVGGNLEQNSDGTGNGPSCRWATILPTATGVQIYVATSTGLYSTSTLNGASTVWALEGASVMGNVVTTMVLSRASDRLVVASTHANGVFSAQALTSVQSQASAVPHNFTLAQNFPNPFNPTTTIQYVVPQRGYVRLSVYDVSGRQVAILAEGEKSSGTYSATWNGKEMNGLDAASGVYFYSLEAAGTSQTKKMVLLK